MTKTYVPLGRIGNAGAHNEALSGPSASFPIPDDGVVRVHVVVLGQYGRDMMNQSGGPNDGAPEGDLFVQYSHNGTDWSEMEPAQSGGQPIYSLSSQPTGFMFDRWFIMDAPKGLYGRFLFSVSSGFGSMVLGVVV